METGALADHHGFASITVSIVGGRREGTSTAPDAGVGHAWADIADIAADLASGKT